MAVHQGKILGTQDPLTYKAGIALLPAMQAIGKTSTVY